MKFENLFHISLIIFLTAMGCDSKRSPSDLSSKVFISLSRDSSSVQLHKVPEDILTYFRSDSLDQSDWASLFAVYPDIADEELRDLQPAIKGKYFVSDSVIIFKPDSAFKKGNAYFARCYSRQILAEPSDLISRKPFSGQAAIAEFRFTR